MLHKAANQFNTNSNIWTFVNVDTLSWTWIQTSVDIPVGPSSMTKKEKHG